jgi:hypothetical protein
MLACVASGAALADQGRAWQALGKDAEAALAAAEAHRKPALSHPDAVG